MVLVQFDQLLPSSASHFTMPVTYYGKTRVHRNANGTILPSDRTSDRVYSLWFGGLSITCVRPMAWANPPLANLLHCTVGWVA